MEKTQQASDSRVRIEMALRGARIAKMALELLTLSPTLAHFQIVEIVKSIRELDQFLQKEGMSK